MKKVVIKDELESAGSESLIMNVINEKIRIDGARVVDFLYSK